MTVAIIAAVVAVLLISTKFVPVSYAHIIEGVLDRISYDTELFKGTKLKVFWCEDYCRNCMEQPTHMKSRPILYGQCHEQVPAWAWKLTDDPEPGHPFRLVGWFNMWGTCVAYAVLRSNFVLDPKKADALRFEKLFSRN